jgi:hypothetical protein
VGAVPLLSPFARDLGVVALLGLDRQGRLAPCQVIDRVLDRGCKRCFDPIFRFAL